MDRQVDISSIYNQFGDAMYAYGRHLGFGEDTVMDAVHDVFYKVCIAPKTLESVSNLKFYLFRMLKNRLIDIHRGNREIAESDFTDDSLPFRLEVTIEDEIIEREDREEIVRQIERILAELTDRQREIIYLRYIHEYEYEEIAQLMQISVLSCRNLISKAMTKLKDTSLPIAILVLVIRELNFLI